MNKLMFSLAFTIVSAVALAAPSASRSSQNHVPEKLDESIHPFTPKAAERPHIVLVNVANAIPEDVWSLAATYAVSRLQINVWTNSLDKSVLDKLVTNPDYTPLALNNKNSLIGVYFERREGGCPIVSSPANWAVVNVEPYLRDAKCPQQIRDRYAKLVMKGLALACGSGNTLEPFCSMFYGAQDPEGMDKSNIALAPICYFPMLETLRAKGGSDMLSPVQE